jgi:hypothetical protein
MSRYWFKRGPAATEGTCRIPLNAQRHRFPSSLKFYVSFNGVFQHSLLKQIRYLIHVARKWRFFSCSSSLRSKGMYSWLYEGESVIIRTVCFIFRKTRAVDQTGESESVRLRLHRGCPNTSKFIFLRFSIVWAVSTSVMDVDWRPIPSPCLRLVWPFLKHKLH